MGDYSQALTAYEEAVRLDSQIFEAWKGLGLAYYEQQRHAKAIGAYLHALRLRPDDTEGWRALGHAYVLEGGRPPERRIAGAGPAERGGFETISRAARGFLHWCCRCSGKMSVPSWSCRMNRRGGVPGTPPAWRAALHVGARRARRRAHLYRHPRAEEEATGKSLKWLVSYHE